MTCRSRTLSIYAEHSLVMRHGMVCNLEHHRGSFCQQSLRNRVPLTSLYPRALRVGWRYPSHLGLAVFRHGSSPEGYITNAVRNRFEIIRSFPKLPNYPARDDISLGGDIPAHLGVRYQTGFPQVSLLFDSVYPLLQLWIDGWHLLVSLTTLRVRLGGRVLSPYQANRERGDWLGRKGDGVHRLDLIRCQTIQGFRQLR